MAGGIVKAVGCQLKTKMVIFSMLLQTAPTLPHQLKNFGSKFIDYQLHINYLSINYVVHYMHNHLKLSSLKSILNGKIIILSYKNSTYVFTKIVLEQRLLRDDCTLSIYCLHITYRFILVTGYCK